MEAILNIPVLFFIFGVLAVLIGSNIKIPEGFITGITMYLMLAIGIKGGISLADGSISIAPILLVVIGSIVVASMVFWFVFRFESRENAAAIAATYGSNSTMTFVTAAAFLSSINVFYGGHMTVALVLMETPAIIYGIYLASKSGLSNNLSVLKEAFVDGTHLLLIASLMIGFITVSLTENTDILYGFVGGDIFTGALCFFLLGMGIKVGASVRENLLKVLNFDLVLTAVIVPWVSGLIGYVAGYALGLSSGDLFLSVLLMASSSYIVAPAILQQAVPKAEVSKYLTMSIAITFPMNILIGIPFWSYIIGL